MRALRAAPVTAPCGLALALVAWWALDDGGFAVGQWAPGGLVLLGLLVVALVAAPNNWRELPRPVAVAAVGLVAYTAWSFASIAWADDPGFALEGAARTLLYAVVFCLFALWPQRGTTGAALLGAWLAVVSVAGLVVALELAGSDDPATLFNFNRLRAPTGYPNASAALLMMPVLPAVVFAAARRIPWWGRGAAAATAVGLAGLALLTVSRGAVYSTPLVVVALFVLVPGRVRHFYALVAVALGVAACAPRLLAVGDAFDGGDVSAALSDALSVLAIAAALVGSLVALVARVEPRVATGPHSAAWLRTAARGLIIAVLAAGVVVGIVVAGDPVDRAQSAWTSFKGGYAENDTDANRLVGGLGSARYDFYRVGLRVWADHPVAGVGADGFYQQYLREGDSAETPRYPHSVELRTLAQTGLVGAVLLFGALSAALVAALRAMRHGSSLRRATAGGATVAFVFWFVQGSLDWFWEWAGLGVPAFALLGLAGSLSRLPSPAAGAPTARRSSRPASGAALAAGLGAAVLAVPLVMLWAGAHLQQQAAAMYATDPLTAYDRLATAARVNPLSAAPETLAGSIALRFGDLRRADAAFARALERVPDDQYAMLERGAIASALGSDAAAEQALARAVALAPRDPLAKEALSIVRRGGTVDVDELNRRIVEANRLLVS